MRVLEHMCKGACACTRLVKEDMVSFFSCAHVQALNMSLAHMHKRILNVNIDLKKNIFLKSPLTHLSKLMHQRVILVVLLAHSNKKLAYVCKKEQKTHFECSHVFKNFQLKSSCEACHEPLNTYKGSSHS